MLAATSGKADLGVKTGYNHTPPTGMGSQHCFCSFSLAMACIINNTFYIQALVLSLGEG
jgi:hypothetical protein